MTKKNNNGGGLATIPKSDFLALDPKGEYAESLSAMAETGEMLSPSDLIRVKTPTGGSTTWMIPGPAGDMAEPTITGALVFYQVCGVLWPTVDFQTGSIPVLKTLDLIKAEQVGPIPDDMVEVLEPYRIDEQHFHWSEASGMPYNQWGSGKDGIGKRCKEQRMLFILRPEDPFPLLITAQPGSLKNVSQWFKRIPLARIPFWRVIVELSLEKVTNKAGQDFARIVPKIVGQVDKKTGDEFKRTWTNKLKAIVHKVEADQVDTE